MIARAIAFDAQEVSTRMKRVDHRQIEEETGAADLCVYRVAEAGQLRKNLFLELGVRWPFGLRGHVHLPCLRIVQECFQRSNARRTRFGYVDVVGAQRCEYLAA